MRTALRLCAGAALLALLFAGLTLAALESSEVVVIRTRADDGSLRETHIWIAEEGGVWMLEAASPESAWYRDLQRETRAEILRGDRVVPVRVTAQPGAEGHRRIRALFRRKYGLADRWIAFIQDGSRSVLVLAEPLPD
jgi:hypothetical protein